MAERKKSQSRPAPRRKKRRASRRPVNLFERFQRPKAEFREDSAGNGLLHRLHVTRNQRLRLLRWLLYIAVCIMALVVQDVIMSRITLFGATTDLVVSAILLITVLEGCEVGSLFALLASIVYFFSGTAPGAYCVGFLTIYGMLMALFRQTFWHRSAGSIILCAGIAVMAYELSLYGAGLFLGLTRWDRILKFVFAGAYSVAALIPLYFLVHRIGLIGGNVWKE